MENSFQNQTPNPDLKAVWISEIKCSSPADWGSAVNPHYAFTVPDFKSLDELHFAILYQGSGEKKLQQYFNYANQSFQIDYSTIGIGATMEVVVRFRATPGARLFYKPEGEREKEITDLINPPGVFRLRDPYWSVIA